MDISISVIDLFSVYTIVIVFHSPVSTVLVSASTLLTCQPEPRCWRALRNPFPFQVQMLLNCRKAANKLLYMIPSYYFITIELNPNINLTKGMKLYLQTQRKFQEKKKKKNTHTTVSNDNLD